jgi:Cu-Zn family superoxide dismutase
MKLHVLFTAATFAVCLLAVAAHADEIVVSMNRIDSTGMGEAIGTITASSSPYGTIFTPDLRGLSPGPHGFHVHEKPDCGPAMKDEKPLAGLAAGGHYDPGGTGKHEGPYGSGHLGDLPPLYVGLDGRATQPVLAPRLKLSELRGRSLMIHAGGDTYSDKPEPLGGGGARVACGVLK